MGPAMGAPDSAVDMKLMDLCITISFSCLKRFILTAEVLSAVLVCVGAGFTGFRACGVGRLAGKVAPEAYEERCDSEKFNVRFNVSLHQHVPWSIVAH